MGGSTQAPGPYPPLGKGENQKQKHLMIHHVFCSIYKQVRFWRPPRWVRAGPHSRTHAPVYRDVTSARAQVHARTHIHAKYRTIVSHSPAVHAARRGVRPVAAVDTFCGFSPDDRVRPTPPTRMWFGKLTGKPRKSL